MKNIDLMLEWMTCNFTSFSVVFQPYLDNWRVKIEGCMWIPYFFGYKMEFFSFQNNPKDLDPSCKMDVDLWDCLGRVKLVS